MKLRKVKEIIRQHMHEIIITKKSPHSIALGFAAGTFISIIPTPGFNILIGVLVILIFKKINKFSLFGSMAVWNPIVLTPVYLLSYRIGGYLFGSTPVVKFEFRILDQVYNFSRRFLVGNLIVAIAFSILSYFLVKNLVIYYQKKHD